MHEILLGADIEKKLRRIETRILSIVNYRDFFEVLLKEIKRTFTIPYTWITLIAEYDIATLIKTSGTFEDLDNYLTVIEREVFLKLIGTSSKPLMVKDDLTRYYALFPQNSSYFIKSLAIAPISLDGTVAGSLNLADFSATRFQHRTYAHFLELLAIKISISLSNVTAHEKSNSLTFHDPITGLLNRNVMETILEREFKRTQRYANDLSLVLIGLNDIDQVFDAVGDQSRDYVFKHVAEKLNQMCRNSDTIARFDADKLAIIMPETKAGNALIFIDRMQRNLKEHPMRIKNRPVSLSLHFGIASTDRGKFTRAQTLLRHAYENLSRARIAAHDNHLQGGGSNITPKVIPLPVAKKKPDKL
jgi:diguanylate cyclase (GGDEF)-like protein